MAARDRFGTDEELSRRDCERRECLRREGRLSVPIYYCTLYYRCNMYIILYGLIDTTDNADMST